MKTILVPAIISLALYILISYVILPLIRRSRQRYSQYLPLHAISSHTSSLRERASDALMNFLLPSSWRQRAQFVDGHGDDDGRSVFDEEEGEGMVGFDMDPARREALERTRGGAAESEGRLSRELEQGFMDDSDEEDNGRGQSRGLSRGLRS
ncbi:hypothetical protein FQN54_005944 [Arachnomyces sp. PD_36]|nr:hypothetical protein FQN54_005944 [Arachnomyces sp. PD_36]